MIGIYRITNRMNNKHYIGQSVNIQRRLTEHCRRQEQYVDKVIKKYGMDSFDFVVIEECLPEELNQREDYWIKQYNSIIPNGYNLGYSYGCARGEYNGGSKLTNEEVVFLRQIYAEHAYTSTTEIWTKFFKDKISLSQFRGIFRGDYWTHIMPEVFNKDNNDYYESQERWCWMNNQNGINNYNATTQEDDVISIRALYTIKDRKTIFQLFPQYSSRNITAIISGQNWTHLPVYKKRKQEWIFPDTYNEQDKIDWLERVKMICLQ